MRECDGCTAKAFDSDIEDPEVLASMRPPEPAQEAQEGIEEQETHRKNMKKSNQCSMSEYHMAIWSPVWYQISVHSLDLCGITVLLVGDPADTYIIATEVVTVGDKGAGLNQTASGNPASSSESNMFSEAVPSDPINFSPNFGVECAAPLPDSSSNSDACYSGLVWPLFADLSQALRSLVLILSYPISVHSSFGMLVGPFPL